MGLLDLPNELLLRLPEYLSNIEDFTNAASSCRTLRTVFAQTHPNRILRLAAASSRVFFRPDPWFFVAATARQVSEWGLENQANTEVLRAAFRGGILSLMELCISVAGITIADVRRMHACRFDTINPVTDMIDRMAGKQWYANPDFWSGGVSEPETLDCEPSRALFQFVIYGELFGSTLQAWLDPDLQLPKYSLEARLDYVKHCIPQGQEAPRQDGVPHVNAASCPHYWGDGVALQHVLRCGQWNRPWEAIRRQIGPDFDEEESWRQEIWVQAAQLHGLVGLEILRPGGFEKWQERLKEIRSNVARMPSKPPVREVETRWNDSASECPNLDDELRIHLILNYYY